MSPVSTVLSNPTQERVRDRLRRLVSEGSAYFFVDACEIVARRPPLKTTTHLVGHLIREVESALRQVLRTLPTAHQLLESSRAKGDQRHLAEVDAILAALKLEQDDTARLWASFVGRSGWHQVAHRQNLRWPRRADEAFVARFDDFVDVLDVVLDAAEANYAQVTKALDELRRKPAPENAADVEALITHLAPGATALAHVFETLASGWLVPLRENGVFSDPPDVQFHDGGSYSFPRWPQGEYLARVASEVAHEVAATIEVIPTCDNELVHLSFLRAACSMPPTEAARVAIHEAVWLEAHFWSVGLPEAVQDLVIHLVDGDEVAAAATLLRAALSLSPHIAGAEAVGPSARMDDWDYEMTVRRALRPLATKAPKISKELLFDLLALESHGKTFTRAAIDESRQNAGEPADMLLNALRDLLDAECVNNEDALRAAVHELESRAHLIYARLALHLLRSHGGTTPDLVVARATDRARLNSIELFHELATMVADRFPGLATDDQARIVDALRDVSSESAARLLLGPQVSTEDVARYARYDRRRWFAILGEARPADVGAEYERLCAGIGEPQHPTFLSWVGRAESGPKTPLKAAEVQALPDDELLAYLKAWTPSSDDPFEPSRRGLMREIKGAATADPVRFARLARDLRGLHSLYVAGAMWGLQEAFQAELRAEEPPREREIDTLPVLDLAAWTSTQRGPDDESPTADGQDWTWTRRTAVDLVVAAALLADAQARSRAVTILLKLLEDPDPSQRRITESTQDDVTLAVNSVRGRALSGLLELVASDSGLKREVLPALVARADAQVEPARAVRSVLAASSPGHGASPSQGHGARETERTTASEPASDRSRRPLVAIGVLDEASDEIFAGSWGQSHDHRRRFDRRRSAGCFIAGAFGGGSASSIFGLSLERYDSPSTTKS